MCGFTIEELKKYYPNLMSGIDEDMLQSKFGGYSWVDGSTKLLNPWDVNHHLDSTFKGSYWTEKMIPQFIYVFSPFKHNFHDLLHPLVDQKR